MVPSSTKISRSTEQGNFNQVCEPKCHRQPKFSNQPKERISINNTAVVSGLFIINQDFQISRASEFPPEKGSQIFPYQKFPSQPKRRLFGVVASGFFICSISQPDNRISTSKNERRFFLNQNFLVNRTGDSFFY